MPRNINSNLKNRKNKSTKVTKRKSSKKGKARKSKKTINSNFNQGKYYFVRDHEWEGGWSIKFEEIGEVIAKVYDKNYALLISELLNKYGAKYTLLSEIENILIENSKKRES